MPRQSKPYFRQQTKSWYCSINGKQIALGKTKTEAFDKFYEFMGWKDDLRSDASTVYQLTQSYLDRCQNNKKPSTYAKHLHYLKSFVESAGKRLKVGQVRKLHLTKWFECDQGDAQGCLFETYGEEYDFIKSFDRNQVWTLIDNNDGDTFILSGLHWVNRLGYLITQNPWSAGSTVEVRLETKPDDEDFP